MNQCLSTRLLGFTTYISAISGECSDRKEGEKKCLELQKVNVTPSYLSPLKAALNLARNASMNTVTYNDSCPRVTPKAYMALGRVRHGCRAPLVSHGIKAHRLCGWCMCRDTAGAGGRAAAINPQSFCILPCAISTATLSA